VRTSSIGCFRRNKQFSTPSRPDSQEQMTSLCRSLRLLHTSNQALNLRSLVQRMKTSSPHITKATSRLTGKPQLHPRKKAAQDCVVETENQSTDPSCKQSCPRKTNTYPIFFLSLSLSLSRCVCDSSVRQSVCLCPPSEIMNGRRRVDESF